MALKVDSNRPTFRGFQSCYPECVLTSEVLGESEPLCAEQTTTECALFVQMNISNGGVHTNVAAVV